MSMMDTVNLCTLNCWHIAFSSCTNSNRTHLSQSPVAVTPPASSQSSGNPPEALLCMHIASPHLLLKAMSFQKCTLVEFTGNCNLHLLCILGKNLILTRTWSL